MFNRLITFIAMVILVIIVSCEEVPAQISGVCNERSKIVKSLASVYGESRKMIILDSAQQVVEIFTSDKTGTWTLLRTTPGGWSCVIIVDKYSELTPGVMPPSDTY